ncbi:MAG: Lipid-A-disaccharide synthase [Fimbriimonadaceae bacterium]|nr:Lipid-A-disaccharide synthase [Fimbriimonadaceae bacterium]
MPRLFISAGEASGDAYGGAIASLLSNRWTLQAIGGRRLRETGAEVVGSSEKWGAIGIVEAIRVGPRVLRGLLSAKRCLRTGEPGWFMPIDYGFFNIRLARVAKEAGWKVLYFIPPGSWRRNKQGADLPSLCDHIVTPFSWSKEILDAMAAKSGSPCQTHFFGHPLKQMIADRRATFAVDSERERIAILPGSRLHEIAHNLPVIAQAVSGLGREVEFAVASTLTSRELSELWSRLNAKVPASIFTEGDTYGVLLRAKAGIVCSGTATLEAALAECPCTVMYRGSKMMEIEYRLRKPKFDFISLPNILAGKMVVPERIQWDATPEAVRSDLKPLLHDSVERQNQVTAFRELDRELGPADALSRTVELIESLSER